VEKSALKLQNRFLEPVESPNAGRVVVAFDILTQNRLNGIDMRLDDFEFSRTEILFAI
tara:strand:+ start:220 stop:393 length:174 start_codon:yes stop_codon:yes gene_type:complete